MNDEQTNQTNKVSVTIDHNNASNKVMFNPYDISNSNSGSKDHIIVNGVDEDVKNNLHNN